MQNGDTRLFCHPCIREKCPYKLPKHYVPKVGHGPKMGQNKFEPVGHGSIGLLKAHFFLRNAQGLSTFDQDTLLENFHQNPRGRD